MDKDVEAFILSAEAKVLATYANGSINAVPVSSITVRNGSIWLINYFMDKSLSNMLSNNNVSLVCWKKMIGYQIKGTVSYLTEGKEFDEAVAWIQSLLPERVVKGLIILSPKEIYDVSPTKDTKETFLTSQK